MSQSQNVIQEPSIDELLASIREIIEENGDTPPSDSGRQAIETETLAGPDQVNNNFRYSADRQDFYSAAKDNNAVPVFVQDAMNALAERIGLRKPPIDNKLEAMIPKPTMAAAPIQPQCAAVKENKSEEPRVAIRLPPQKKKGSIEMKQEVHESEKAFQADVERSAELLLRPYIVQWLNEHFRQLFERVLREEIQRFIQVLRR
ncbi:MAG: hypothetical protein JSC189_000162 [Candidatus Tokpelaia sp. JSC189]|nr:MAG: hypothetical protein JSC189_000162 [Candidatus Tokpelaia sp. JSC189]